MECDHQAVSGYNNGLPSFLTAVETKRVAFAIRYLQVVVASREMDKMDKFPVGMNDM